MKSKVVWKHWLANTGEFCSPEFDDIARLVEKVKEFPKATWLSSRDSEGDEFWLLVEGSVAIDDVQRALEEIN